MRLVAVELLALVLVLVPVVVLVVGLVQALARGLVWELGQAQTVVAAAAASGPQNLATGFWCFAREQVC